MDPSLRKEKEAFKRRAIAATEKTKKSKEAAAKSKASVQLTQTKKVKKQIQVFHIRGERLIAHAQNSRGTVVTVNIVPPLN